MTSETIVNREFIVQKQSLKDHRITETALPDLQDGEVCLATDGFAFTANNITYAAMGDRMRYWEFFPSDQGFGKIPVWGFADVVASKHDAIPEGSRYYGYYPMSSHLVVRPQKVSPASFMDGAAHRAQLPVIYNLYVNTATDPSYVQEGEALQALYRPLFMTSFLIDDFLAENNNFGAAQVIFSSASSKTAYCAAYLAAKREGLKVVGLTSKGNAAFTQSLGFYDEIVTYDDIEELDGSVPTVYVDMAGSTDIRARVHTNFGDNLVYSCSVGASHWEEMGGGGDLPGAKPQLFFAPSQGQKRMQEWGAEGFQARTGAAWAGFIGKAEAWVDVKHHKGAKSIADIYLDTLEGRAKPRDGHILSF
ncbi:DUF2855 family protein [Kordiimonas sp.]|uniref:DUF2855 family protein n=1 Tax=Kordiimonas sp. TaxID=1970157 RepID=UPI003A9077AB